MKFWVDFMDISVDYFVDRKCLAEWKLDEQIIDFHNLMYLYKGRCEFFINGKSYLLKAGDLIYAPQGISRKAHTYPEDLMQCYVVAFRIVNGSPVEASISIPTVTKIEMDDDLFELFRDLNQTWLEKDDGYLLKCRALFMLVLHRLIKINKAMVLMMFTILVNSLRS